MSIQLQLVNEGKRSAAIESVFGNRCIQFETAVYNIMSSLSADYHGGYWDYYLADGVFLMALKTGKMHNVSNPYNYFEGQLDSFDLSIAANLMAISAISARTGASQEMLTTWEGLQKMINALPRRADIRRLLD